MNKYPTELLYDLTDEISSSGFLELISAGPGLVQIKGMETDLCLCFNDDGHLYGEVSSKDENNNLLSFYIPARILT